MKNSLLHHSVVCPVEVFLEFFDMETILKVSSQKHAARERKHGGQEATRS